ncbi:hypothetical protein B0H10DRAFT_2013933 [Mycena sp. CBHHK59/15]|nr:hypothetical protein B0H10DRAFT_2013933 [Mycena sp. CBHHK59/15]
MDVDPAHPAEAPPTPITTQPSPPQGRSRSFRGDAFEQQPARRPLYYDYGGAAVRRGPEQSFLAPYGATGGVYGYEHGGSARYDSGGSGQSFLGHPFARLSPPAHTPSPPAPGINGNTLPSAPRALAPNGNGSRPSTGNGARLPPLSAVVSSSAFRPSSGHGAPSFGVPGNGGSILLPNSLTLRRPSTGDWECDAWRPGTAPGGLGGRYGPAVAAAAVDPDVSPFSFHPPEQPAASNPRKRAFGGPDGPHGAHPDGGASGGGEGEHYEYGSESRPASRRLSVMELCNSDTDTRVEQPPSPLSRRPTTTNGLVSRASALVLHDREQQPRFEPGHAHAEHLAAAGSRGRAGSLRGRDAAAPGGAAAAGARGGGDAGGVPAAAAFLPGAGAAAHRGGAVPPHAAAAAAAAAVPAALRGRASTSASPPASPGYGPPGPGYGGGGGVSPPRGAYGGGGGGDSHSPAGYPHPGAGRGQRAASAGDSPAAGAGFLHPGSPPSPYSLAYPPTPHPYPRRYAAGGGHAEVRELEFGGAGAGRGPGPAGYEHEHGHRVGGRRGGGMRV